MYVIVRSYPRYLSRCLFTLNMSFPPKYVKCPLKVTIEI